MDLEDAIAKVEAWLEGAEQKDLFTFNVTPNGDGVIHYLGGWHTPDHTRVMEKYNGYKLKYFPVFFPANYLLLQELQNLHPFLNMKDMRDHHVTLELAESLAKKLAKDFDTLPLLNLARDTYEKAGLTSFSKAFRQAFDPLLLFR